MTSIFARVIRGIFSSYVKGLIFHNGKTDHFKESWSDLQPEIKTQYLSIADEITEKILQFAKKKA